MKKHTGFVYTICLIGVPRPDALSLSETLSEWYNDCTILFLSFFFRTNCPFRPENGVLKGEGDK